MHIVLTHEGHAAGNTNQNYQGNQPASEELLRRFGISDLLRETQYMDKPNRLGVFPDLKNPVFFAPAYAGWRERDLLVAEVLVAAMLVHEGQHCRQLYSGLPHIKEKEELLVYLLRYYSGLICNYRNGRGLKEHIEEAGYNGEGNDYVFGR